MNKRLFSLKPLAILVIMSLSGFVTTVTGQTVLATETFETGGSTLFSITHDYGTVEITSSYANTGSFGFGYWNQGVAGIQTATL